MENLRSWPAVLRRLSLGALAVLLVACSESNPGAPPPPPPPPPPPAGPTLALSATTVTVTDTIATGATSVGTVAVTNSGSGSMSVRLGTVTFGGTRGGPVNGWLTAALSDTAAPATLTLRPATPGLRDGTYTATIPVTASGANSPQNVTLSFVMAPPPQPPAIAGTVVVATGNLGCNGDLARASAAATASVNPDAVFLLGDNALPQGGRVVTSLEDYQTCLDPAWGQFRSRIWAALGEKEQDSATGMADGADAYFGPDRVGPAGKNYYSFNLGTWHVVVLNAVSGGPQRPVPYYLGSEQSKWLWDDLKANQNTRCTLVFWHDPMWISSNDPATPNDPYPNHGYRNQPMRGIWMYLYQWNADLVINGGMHIYERFGPMRYEGTYTNPDPAEFRADSARGIRQLTSGLGGSGPVETPAFLGTHPLSEYRSGGNGVLKVTLGSDAYTWVFINTRWSTIMDRGSGTCH
jgi:hypothetical protein